MIQRAGRRASFMLAAVFAIVLAGCGRSPSGCLQATSFNGVLFSLDGVLHERPVAVTACVDDVCLSRRIVPVSASGPAPVLLVEDNKLQSPWVVQVRLDVTTITGHPIFSATGRAQLRRFQPNGPKCPPTTYSARVEAQPPGSLHVSRWP